jgi:uncharacterized membrane protein YgcG
VLRSLVLGASIVAATAFPPPTGPVVDSAQVIPSAIEREVEGQLLDFQQRSGATIAIAVVTTTAPLTPDAYATALADAWELTTDPSARVVVLVLDVDRRRPGLRVSTSLDGTLSTTARRHVIDDVVGPALAADDTTAALEQGAIELRRALGDATVPPVTAPPGSGQPRHEDPPGHPWLILAIVGAAVVLAAAALVLVARGRRRWALQAPVVWGSGWGRAVIRPGGAVHRRYRRVRDALHEAEAETGLPLCLWFGPVDGDAAALADGLFAHADREGHAAALVLVDSRGSAIELRVAEWARTRLAGINVAGLESVPKVDALAAISARFAAAGSALARPGPGGVGPPPR